MEIIKMKHLKLSVILVILLCSPILAQLPPGFFGAPTGSYQSYVLPKKMVIATASAFLYQRYPGPNLFYLATGNPTVGVLVTVTPSATFESNANTYIRNAPLFISQEYLLSAASSVATRAVTLNAFGLYDDVTLIVSVNSGVTVGSLTINIALGVPTSSSGVAFSVSPNYFFGSSTPNRKLTLKISYVGSGNVSAVSVALWVPMANWGVGNAGATANFERISILWPGGESPVFSRVSGSYDLVHLYWTGRGWPSSLGGGNCYGIASVGYY